MSRFLILYINYIDLSIVCFLKAALDRRTLIVLVWAVTEADAAIRTGA